MAARWLCYPKEASNSAAGSSSLFTPSSVDDTRTVVAFILTLDRHHPWEMPISIEEERRQLASELHDDFIERLAVLPR
jgi:signal transduction histidine kinase